jgi:hypothetical protein
VVGLRSVYLLREGVSHLLWAGRQGFLSLRSVNTQRDALFFASKVRGDDEDELEAEHDARVQWIYCCDGPYSLLAVEYVAKIIYLIITMVMKKDYSHDSTK